MLPRFGAEVENVENAENDHHHCRLKCTLVCLQTSFAFSQNAFAEKNFNLFV